MPPRSTRAWSTAGEEARAVVAAAGIPVERIDVLYELDMHYLGQTHTVAVPLPVTLEDGTTGVTRGDHPRRRSRRPMRPRSAGCCRACRSASSSLRIAAIGRRPALRSRRRSRPAPDASLEKARTRHAPGLVRRRAGARRRSGRGSSCRSARVIEAPAILEQPDATTVIDPGLRGRVDALGNLIVERG